ncbi:hypothetical protein LO771_11115 [Streptacidiphilus sp. ASG 303]|uniref:hypothetical protein n=1 Tax=Streptacidiphilus sp. ASG 303 TaxID=2896847 RepID=UPI001E545D8B|nr:hypothetical protein [Streptacidiphilus sp. ASG 303]MCD0482934.1 hypothetical protein [Streptacidiphilus sp. ASG 303]
MKHSNHRKPRQQRAQQVLRLGLLATAGLAAVATAAPAQAATTAAPQGGSGLTMPEVHVHADTALSNANRLHTRDFRTSFAIHEYGDTVGAGIANRAYASSVGCNGSDHCRSVALSFQIVTMGGSHTHLNASNVSKAVNNHCTGCETMAGAYQFIVDTPQAMHLTSSDRAKLTAIQHELASLRGTTDSPAVLKQKADALAGRVVAVLRSAAARTPSRPAPTRAGFFASPTSPRITVHSLMDGWPS